MKRRLISLFFTLCFACVRLLVFAQFEPKKNEKVNVIFDTDFGPDYDDVGAIAMLHAYADSGYVNILGTIASTRYEGVAASLDVFNTYFGRPNIPIGVPKHALNRRDWQFWSDTVRYKYPHQIKENRVANDAIELYRKILASQSDNSITIITVGFFSNIAMLMKSGPDKYSPLNGEQLVNKKVRLMVSMAGVFPKGKEFNVDRDAESSYYVFRNWKKPILFSGFEIGKKIYTGLELISNDKIKNSPVKDVFRLCIPKSIHDVKGRMSWDQTTVLVGVKGYEPYYSIKKGRFIIHEDGRNEWKDDSEGIHAYLVEKSDFKSVEKLIETTMMHIPIR